MQDVSGFGLVVTLRASNTFPSGISLTEFADDADPFDIPSLNIADTAMNVNGSLVAWSKPNPVKITINVIPGSDDDQNLAALFDANRVGPGRQSAQDEIFITAVYPQGNQLNLLSGKLTDGMPGASVASAGRQKSKSYQFHFEDFNRS